MSDRRISAVEDISGAGYRHASWVALLIGPQVREGRAAILTRQDPALKTQRSVWAHEKRVLSDGNNRVLVI